MQSLSWFRWSVARFIATSRLPQAAAFIPAIGYALIWSDDFSRWIGSKEKLGDGILISTLDARLQFLWWGAVFMTMGWLVYLLRCPKVVRRCGEPDDYVYEQLRLQNMANLGSIVQIVKDHAGNIDQTERRPLIYGQISPQELYRAINSVFAAGIHPFGTNGAHFFETIYKYHYHLTDNEQNWVRHVAVILLSLGAFLFLVPSADVFLRVLRKLLGFG